MRIFRKICIIMIILLFAVSFQNNVFADDTGDPLTGGGAGGKDVTSFDSISVGTIVTGASDNTGAANSINKMIGAVLTVVQVIGVGVAVIMLVVLAIKYIAASPGDKAEIKKHAVVYVVGAVVLFAASGILGIIRKFASNISAA